MINTILTNGSVKEQSLAQSSINKNGDMKIAIPLANQNLCMHFGHCEQFAPRSKRRK